MNRSQLLRTLCLLEIEPDTGVTRLANAGHPPPLLVTGGRARFLTHHTPLLGMPGSPATKATFAVAPGDVLVLFTDGLVERRGRGVDEGLTVHAEVCAVVEEDLERFCDRLLAEVGPPEPDDDIAIVVLRRT